MDIFDDFFACWATKRVASINLCQIQQNNLKKIHSKTSKFGKNKIHNILWLKSVHVIGFSGYFRLCIVIAIFGKIHKSRSVWKVL